MNKSATPPPVKLVCALLYREEKWLELGLLRLQTEFGAVDFRSSPLDFRFTDYYFREMGTPLYRSFVSFQNLFDPSHLALFKVFTNSLEKELAEPERRRVLNIDPGYLNRTAYILATSKNYAHRIYLGRGVFGQQELFFEKKRIQTLEWTYPDYRSYEYQEILRKIRQIYLSQLKVPKC